MRRAFVSFRFDACEDLADGRGATSTHREARRGEANDDDDDDDDEPLDGGEDDVRAPDARRLDRAPTDGDARAKTFVKDVSRSLARSRSIASA